MSSNEKLSFFKEMVFIDNFFDMRDTKIYINDTILFASSSGSEDVLFDLEMSISKSTLKNFKEVKSRFLLESLYT